MTITVTNLFHGHDVESNSKAGQYRTGYVVGGGLEYAMSPAWSVKAEYQYIDLGRSIVEQWA